MSVGCSTCSSGTYQSRACTTENDVQCQGTWFRVNFLSANLSNFSANHSVYIHQLGRFLSSPPCCSSYHWRVYYRWISLRLLFSFMQFPYSLVSHRRRRIRIRIRIRRWCFASYAHTKMNHWELVQWLELWARMQTGSFRFHVQLYLQTRSACMLTWPQLEGSAVLVTIVLRVQKRLQPLESVSMQLTSTA